MENIKDDRRNGISKDVNDRLREKRDAVVMHGTNRKRNDRRKGVDKRNDVMDRLKNKIK